MSAVKTLKFNSVKCLANLWAALALLSPFGAWGQSRELKDFTNATNQFFSGAPMAEDTLGRFVASYTNSPLRAGAILLQARARIKLTNYAGALQLLEPAPPGKLEPSFIFWAAQAYYGEGRYDVAIERCISVIRNSNSAPPLPLDAALLEADAYSKLGDWANVIAQLSLTDGAFQTAARATNFNPGIAAGNFLLTEAYFNEGRFEKAQETVSAIPTNALGPDLGWKRQYLLCRILLQLGHTNEALAGCSNLTSLMNPGRTMVDTYDLQGDIFEKAGQYDKAIEAYSQNLANTLPPAANPAEANRNAFRKIIELKRREDQPTNTMAWLDDFIKQRPGDAVLDLARYHLGDLQLRAFFNPADSTNAALLPDTNFLAAATSNLDVVIHTYTNSEILGQAYLDRGWCDWTNGDFAAATKDFSLSVNLLKPSDLQATALFKLADSEYRAGDYRSAAANYDRLLNNYTSMASVSNSLFEPALYQLVQANLQLGNSDAAQTAAGHLIRWFGDTSSGERSYLLIGEDLSSRLSKFTEARDIFNQLLQSHPTNWAEIQLALTRTYEQEGDWTNAMMAYRSLEGMTNFPTNYLPQLKYSLALTFWKANQDSNALAGMSNIVVQFPSDNHAALAQYWIGCYLFNNNRPVEANYAFQEVFHDFTNAGPLVWQAHLMADRAALKNKAFDNASNDLRSLAFDTNTPAPFNYQAHFQFGNFLFQVYQQNQTNDGPLSDSILQVLRDAVSHMQTVATNTNGVNNTLLSEAAGRVGDFYMALADHIKTNADVYTNAAGWYGAALADTNETPDDIAVRNQAEYGLGLIAEHQRLTNDALFHYGKILFDPTANSSWVKNAGVNAAALYLKQGDWSGATNVYFHVQNAIPALRDEMQLYIDRLTVTNK